MVPLQYILNGADLDAALNAGARWLQLSDADALPADTLANALDRCHAAGAYLVLTDAVALCRNCQADGVLLTARAIATIADGVPQPSGIVMQQPRPVTLAIGEARRTLGEDSPQFVGVEALTPEDAVAAARAGADFIQAPVAQAIALLQAVRSRSFTTPIVALGIEEPDTVPTLLDAGISGVACRMTDVPPLMVPLILSADE